MLNVAVAELAAESATFTPKLKDPRSEGVPEITPAENNVSPFGNVPLDRLHVYGLTPPVAESVVL